MRVLLDYFGWLFILVGAGLVACSAWRWVWRTIDETLFPKDTP